MQHKQYVLNARDQYADFDTFDEIRKQRILTQLYTEHRQQDPYGAERLRQQQYRVSKRQKGEAISERTTALERELAKLKQDVARLELIAMDLVRVTDDLRRVTAFLTAL